MRPALWLSFAVTACSSEWQSTSPSTPETAPTTKTASATDTEAPKTCELPAGSWIMSKKLISGSALCPVLADELFLSPSPAPIAVPSGCTSHSDVTEVTGGRCGLMFELDCPDNSRLVLDQDMFDGGYGNLYVTESGLTCLYETQVTRYRK